jgi:hypothetical protein
MTLSSSWKKQSCATVSSRLHLVSIASRWSSESKKAHRRIWCTARYITCKKLVSFFLLKIISFLHARSHTGKALPAVLSHAGQPHWASTWTQNSYTYNLLTESYINIMFCLFFANLSSGPRTWRPAPFFIVLNHHKLCRPRARNNGRTTPMNNEHR